MLKNSKWRSSSEDDEYSDPLEVAASAGFIPHTLVYVRETLYI